MRRPKNGCEQKKKNNTAYNESERDERKCIRHEENPLMLYTNTKNQRQSYEETKTKSTPTTKPHRERMKLGIELNETSTLYHVI